MNASTDGTPPVRALFFEFPDEVELVGVDRQFMIGGDVLVTPALESGVTEVDGKVQLNSFSASRVDWVFSVVALLSMDRFLPWTRRCCLA